MKAGFNVAVFFYATMVGIPILLLLITLLSPFPSLISLRNIFGALLGIASIIFGVVSFWEVFLHG